MPEKELDSEALKKYPVITVSREYGALGKTLAEILSERLGIPYYDKDFVKKTVEESGYAQEDVEREGEELGRSEAVLEKVLNSAVSFSSSHDAIFRAQKKVVLDLAKSPCIIVGRAADHILREAGIDAFSIYLYAAVNERVKNAKRYEEYGKSGELNIEKYVAKRDQMRRTFYKKYTGCDMGSANNYNICFDTGRIRINTCADIVCRILEED